MDSKRKLFEAAASATTTSTTNPHQDDNKFRKNTLPLPGKLNIFQRPSFTDLMTGSIAEREHRKWSESAVAMPNNPYTQEKVWERKISRTQFNNFPVRKR